MNFIYFGSDKFSRVVLDTICKAGLKPALVVTQPDRPKGRHLKSTSTEIGAYAAENGLACVKPASIKTPEFLSAVKSYAPGFLVIADYGNLVPQAVLDCASILPVAVHPSLLPLYRGATPLNRALINGDKETGVTLFKAVKSMDSGPVISQRKIALGSEENVITLSDKLARSGGELAVEVLSGKGFTLTEQDHRAATYAPKLVKEDGLIDWNKSAAMIDGLVRGLLEWPVAYTFYDGKPMQILNADAIERQCGFEPGVVLDINKEGIDVATGSGVLRIKEVKPQAKGRMSAFAFSCGQKIKAGDRFLAHG